MCCYTTSFEFFLFHDFFTISFRSKHDSEDEDDEEDFKPAKKSKKAAKKPAKKEPAKPVKPSKPIKQEVSSPTKTPQKVRNWTCLDIEKQ